MELMFLFVYFVLFIIAIILSIQSVKFFITMWKFKNRKKDGSEDKDFKYFD